MALFQSHERLSVRGGPAGASGGLQRQKAPLHGRDSRRRDPLQRPRDSEKAVRRVVEASKP